MTLGSGGENFTTPVPGSDKSDGGPTSADVHLYADPLTLSNANPIFFVDCKGLGGGNGVPTTVEAHNGLSLGEVLLQTSM
jgi:hypothetical protein